MLDAFWYEPRHLTITRKDLFSRSLPGGLDGLRIGLMADFHFRPGHDDGLMNQVVAAVRDEKPDLIAFTGDYISHDPGVVAPLLERLGKMAPALGMFAVMGNHDGWAGDPAKIKRQFEDAGISFLINRHSILSIRGESLAIAGTDYVWRGKPDPARTLRGIASTTPIVALVHEPDYFDTMTADREILLQLSGHSHGGQCQVPLLGYAPCKVKYGRKYIEGAYSNGASNLFVTRGVGTTGPRARFACPPELAILTLRAQGSTA